MIHAAIQKRPVVGHQNKALFRTQILAHQPPAPDIQMVCRLVNEQKIVLFGKQYRKLELRLFPVAQGAVGPIKHLVVQLQFCHFPLNLPIFVVRIHGFHRVNGQDALVCHGIWKIRKLHRSGNPALIVVFSQKQIQEGGFAPAVPAGEAQTPVGIDLEADVLKNVFIAAVIGKCQIGNLNQRHSCPPNTRKMAAGKHPAANTICRPHGHGSTMSVDPAHTFLHQGITNTSGRFAAFCIAHRSARSIAHPFNSNLFQLFGL